MILIKKKRSDDGLCYMYIYISNEFQTRIFTHLAMKNKIKKKRKEFLSLHILIMEVIQLCSLLENSKNVSVD